MLKQQDMTETAAVLHFYLLTKQRYRMMTGTTRESAAWCQLILTLLVHSGSGEG